MKTPINIIYDILCLSNDLNTEEGMANAYSMILEMQPPICANYIKLKYFRNIKGPVQRLQEIPEKYYLGYSDERLFVSHKWKDVKHPDLDRQTLNDLLRRTSGFSDDTAIWWDYCSLPQRNPATGIDDRSDFDKLLFKFQLSLIPFIILDTRQLFLWSGEAVTSGWCSIEVLVSFFLLEDLNWFIDGGKSTKISNPYFMPHIEGFGGGETTGHRERVFATATAYKHYLSLKQWLLRKVGLGKSVNFHNISNHLTQDIILDMLEAFGLKFTNGSDKIWVSNFLHKITNRISVANHNTTQLSGEDNLRIYWHYIRGTYGSCVMPSVAYWF